MQKRVVIHIGYHKTGSTFFQKVIFPNHPNIKLVDRTSLQRSILLVDSFSFDPNEVRAWITEEMEAASPEQDLLVLSDEELSGNIHTGGNGGYLAKEVADRLYASLPGAHIVVFIRNQPDMIESVYRQYVKKGGTFGPEKYLLDNDGLNHRFPQFSFSHFEYNKLINYYRTLFGQEQVHVFLYELFSRDIHQFLIDFFNVLGLPPLQNLDQLSQTRVNERLSSVSIFLARLTNKFYGSDPINRRVVIDLPILYKIFARLYQQLDQTALIKNIDQNRTLLNPHIRNLISSRYSDSNLELSQMLGIDLSKFGYPMKDAAMEIRSLSGNSPTFESISGG